MNTIPECGIDFSVIESLSCSWPILFPSIWNLLLKTIENPWLRLGVSVQPSLLVHRILLMPRDVQETNPHQGWLQSNILLKRHQRA